MYNGLDTYGRSHPETKLKASTARADARKFPNNRWTNIFLGCTVIESLCAMGLEAYIFYRFFQELNLSNGTARTIPTYLALFICAFIFQLCIAFFAVAQRNTLHILGLSIFNLAFLAYSAIQIRETHDVIFGENTDTKRGDVFLTSSTLYTTAPGSRQARHDFWHDLLPYLIAVPCIVGLAQLFYILTSYKLYKVFGWELYTKFGADRRIKRYFLSYQLLVVLLCYDWFFFGSFSVQLLILYVDTSNWEFWITVAALPVTIFGLLAAGFAVRRELRWLLLLFDLCLVAGLTYFCYKFWRIFGSSRSYEYSNDRITLGVFAGISIVLLVLTFIMSVICQSFFGTADLWAKARALDDTSDVAMNELDNNNNNTYLYNARLTLD